MNGAGAICAARGDIGAVRGDMGMSGDSGRNGMSCGEVTGVSLWCEPSGPKKRVRGDPGIFRVSFFQFRSNFYVYYNFTTG